MKIPTYTREQVYRIIFNNAKEEGYEGSFEAFMDDANERRIADKAVDIFMENRASTEAIYQGIVNLIEKKG